MTDTATRKAEIRQAFARIVGAHIGAGEILPSGETERLLLEFVVTDIGRRTPTQTALETINQCASQQGLPLNFYHDTDTDGFDHVFASVADGAATLQALEKLEAALPPIVRVQGAAGTGPLRATPALVGRATS